MFRIQRYQNDQGVFFTLLDPNDGIVIKRFLPDSKAIIAPLFMQDQMGRLNTRLVLDCGGAR